LRFRVPRSIGAAFDADRRAPEICRSAWEEVA
jgi:hypothetical protein